VAGTHVLLLRCSGPLQSWGVESLFTTRDTLREPTKSGAVGLLAAALGRPRGADLADLAALKMGVRVDQEGTLLRDYHTAGQDGYATSTGGVEWTNVIVTKRYYLQDARFLVALEGEDLSFLSDLQRALADPVWALFLGRKACVPGEPVWLADGLQPETRLEAALRGYPWLVPAARVRNGRRPERLRLVLEDLQGEAIRPDQPISFHERDRRYAPRRVHTSWCPCPERSLDEEVLPCSSPA
jgi:CRISPR system Cascade subunit CasD